MLRVRLPISLPLEAPPTDAAFKRLSLLGRAQFLFAGNLAIRTCPVAQDGFLRRLCEAADTFPLGIDVDSPSRAGLVVILSVRAHQRRGPRLVALSGPQRMCMGAQTRVAGWAHRVALDLAFLALYRSARCMGISHLQACVVALEGCQGLIVEDIVVRRGCLHVERAERWALTNADEAGAEC